jgi:hypothetical protein
LEKKGFSSMSKALFLKMSLSSFENFITNTKTLDQDPINQFNECQQACNLMIMNKSSLIDEYVRTQACPTLSSKQILQILKMVNYKN